MKMTLTALSLMLVLGSVSTTQAATFAATHETATQHKEFTATESASRNTVAKSPIESDFAATHTVNTHMGAFGVDSRSVDLGHPEGTKRSAADANCNVNPEHC